MFDQYSEHACDTPMQGNEAATMVGTPMIGMTPLWETAMSSRYGPMSERQTPAHDGGAFSPAPLDMYGFGNGISSPGYQSPSPQYGSPGYRNHGSVQYASPLYHQQSPNINN